MGRAADLEAALAAAQASIEERNRRLVDGARALGHARRDIDLLTEELVWRRALLDETRESEAKLRAEIVWLRGQLADGPDRLREQLVARADEIAWLRDCLRQSDAKAVAAEAALSAGQRRGLPWRAVRRLGRLATKLGWRAPAKIELAGAAPVPVGEPASVPHVADPPVPALTSAPRRCLSYAAVHQFHAGSGKGDAITNAMLFIQSHLRRYGFRSEIFVEDRGPGLESQINLMASIPAGDDFFLLVHHSMGFGAFDNIRALPVPKGLIYHNITPPEFLDHMPAIAGLARLGQEQLVTWRDHVVFSLSVSDYNAADLHRLDFPSIQTCPLLIDVDALVHRAAGPRQDDGIFTVLFVGRVTRSKGQLDLVAAFAAFRSRFGRPCRLVLVGALNPDEYAYLEAIEALMAVEGLQGLVHLTDLVSDDELDSWYRRADLYVSLSSHEGFCVPLLEALAYGIPVLAWPAGAVPDTLADAGVLLKSRDPAAVAGAMLAVTARSPEDRRAARAHGIASLQRFAPEPALTLLLDVLARAGAVAPVEYDRA